MDLPRILSESRTYFATLGKCNWMENNGKNVAGLRKI